jgi:hypothetical protein
MLWINAEEAEEPIMGADKGGYRNVVAGVICNTAGPGLELQCSPSRAAEPSPVPTVPRRSVVPLRGRC